MHIMIETITDGIFFQSSCSRERKIEIKFKIRMISKLANIFPVLQDNRWNWTHSVSQCVSRRRRALVLLLAFDSRLSCLLTLLQHRWASCLRDQPWPSNLVNFNTLTPWLSRRSHGTITPFVTTSPRAEPTHWSALIIRHAWRATTKQKTLLRWVFFVAFF